jgi:hypothetical protein
MRLSLSEKHRAKSWDLIHEFPDILKLHTTICDLRSDGTKSTLNRIFESKHVRDLKLIAGTAAWIIIVGILLLLSYELTTVIHEFSLAKLLEAIGKFGASAGAIVAVGGAVGSWVYRTASTRLGIVDLFASEITTLCRVGTIVDMISHSIGAFQCDRETVDSKSTAPSHTQKEREIYTPQRFTSSENYFPVFESNSRDLQLLEARIVINVTAFYTYMKVVRDYLRAASEMPPTPCNNKGQTKRQQTWRNMIYMLFLAYEAARHSVDDLIEYEPTHAENIVTILLTEVPAYRFLLDSFRDDFRHGRLMLRYPDYERVANELRGKIINRGDEQEWDKAIELWPELRKRYQRFLDIDIGEVHARRVESRVDNTGRVIKVKEVDQ